MSLTVKELISKLKQYPKDRKVWIRNFGCTGDVENAYLYVNADGEEVVLLEKG